MKVNPSAVVFWVFFACIGYIIYGDFYHAVCWLIGAMAFSFLIQIASYIWPKYF